MRTHPLLVAAATVRPRAVPSGQFVGALCPRCRLSDGLWLEMREGSGLEREG